MGLIDYLFVTLAAVGAVVWFQSLIPELISKPTAVLLTLAISSIVGCGVIK